MIHELKTWLTVFEAVVDGRKTFELRKNDRWFSVGDSLRLLEYNSISQAYTGREVWCRVTYIVDSVPEWGLMDGYCIMGLAKEVNPTAIPQAGEKEQPDE